MNAHRIPLVFLGIALAALLALAGCSLSEPVPATGISLDLDALTVGIGASRVLTATVSPFNAIDKTVTWSSDNSAVASVDANGAVTGVALGQTRILATAVDGGFTDSCTVTVVTAATALVLDKSTETVIVGTTSQITATPTPANAGVDWTTSDANVATVSATGLVTAGRMGTATITATTTDGTRTAACAVTVTTLYAGQYENILNFPCYWLGNTFQSLSTGISYGYALSPAAVSGNTVYAAGYFNNSTTDVPCYWAGTTRNPLDTAGSPAYAYALVLSDGFVYSAGEYDLGASLYQACYWKGASLQNLGDGILQSVASSITVSGGTVYTAGSYIDSGKRVPCYWVGPTTTPYPLTGGSGLLNSANAIAVSGSTVYTAGRYYNGTNWVACSWAGSTTGTGIARTELSVPTSRNAMALAIYVSGSTVYTAGYTIDGSTHVACYWVGTERHDLTGDGTNTADACTIAVSGGTVYIGGQYYNGTSGRYEPCYWEDVTLHSLAGTLTGNASVVCYGTF